jgi:hypothetical protein
MTAEWKRKIAIGLLVKRAMMETDVEMSFSYYLPEVAATESQLVDAEKSLGHTLDGRYKEFLRCANGWQGFWHISDLFGTSDLIGGPRLENVEHLLSLLDNGVLKSASLERHHLLPITATRIDRDLFVITRPTSPSPGLVIWFAGEEIERFRTFEGYFLAMIEYGRQDVKWLKDRQKKK